jgi:hypothetical protein
VGTPGRNARLLTAGIVTVVGFLVFCATAFAKSAQTITFHAPQELNPGVTAVEQLKATSGLEVVLSSETPSVCTVSRDSSGNTWAITAIEEGTCTVLVTQAGSVEYEAAEERLSFPVTAPRINLGKAPTHAVVGSTYSVGGMVENGPHSVQLSVLTASVCEEVKGRKRDIPQPSGHFSFTVKFIAAGTCTVAVRAEGRFRPVEVRQSISVTESHEQKLAKALKVCRKDRSKRKRKKCETATKKEYKERANREQAEEKATSEAEERKGQEEEVKAKRGGEERREALGAN